MTGSFEKTTLYETLVEFMQHRANHETVPVKDKTQFCFMPREHVVNGVLNVELSDLQEWLMYISFKKIR